MRFLLTFLLLACVQSFVVCTQKDGSITFVQKSVHTLGNGKEAAKIFSINTAHKLNKIHSYPVFKRVHQFISDYKSVVKNTLYTKTIVLVFTFKSIPFFKSKIDFIDRYTFNCLYPKHTFW